MKNLSEITNKPGYEIFWDELRGQIALFINDEPISYLPLQDDKNTMNNAIAAASILINNGGIKFK